MKKIIPILLALVAFAGSANAQITIKKSDVDRPEQLTILSPMWSWLYKSNNAYYLVMKSDNQFDDWFWLRIGETKDECLESIESLQELCKTITDKDRFEIDNGKGKQFIVTQYKALGITGLHFDGGGYAGFGYLLPANLAKAQKWIQKNVE